MSQFTKLVHYLQTEGKVVEFKITWPLEKDRFKNGEQVYMEETGGPQRRAIITGTRYGPVVLYEGGSTNGKLQAPEEVKQILIYHRPNEVDGERFILGHDGRNIGEWIEQVFHAPAEKE